ncbi:MAG: phosphoadenosine phosphosulfate reductase family protein [Clostridia bacterium]|nr:phosphoadenosine phosphosulfate reductase family protein [Clostridia bacterium]
MLEELRIGDNGTYIYDKVAVAIDRLKCFEALALEYSPEGYYLCDSGGKDSSVIKQLAIMADVKHGVHHNHTTLDHPETVYFVRREKARYEDLGIPYTIHYPKMSFWRLMRKKRMPPMRLARYCCAELKEHGGKDRVCITGVRWAESTRRKTNRGIVEIASTKAVPQLMITNDNEESRKEFETCTAKGKRVVNPIIDWTDDEVWEFIERYLIPVNPLYDFGFKRVGCVGCPMNTHAAQELDALPKYKQAFIRTMQRMINDRIADGGTPFWKNGEEYYEYWVSGKAMPKDDDQIGMDFSEVTP